MTQSDDPSWQGNRADRYAVEACLTDAQANRLIDEVFAAVEAEVPPEQELAAVIEPSAPTGTTLLVPYEPLAEPHAASRPAFERARPLHFNPDVSWCDRFLMGVGIASFVLSVGLWINGARQPTAVVPPETATTSAADVAFAEYLQTSLQLLSQQPTPTPTLAQETLPQTAAEGAVERIYVPIYQPPSAAAVTVPQLPSVSPPPAATTDTIAVAPVTPPPPQHTLVGILELGDRSVALIQTNGQTLRLNVGDTVGTDGWQLVQIQNQRAVLRRQGEVRSLTVGQSF